MMGVLMGAAAALEMDATDPLLPPSRRLLMQCVAYSGRWEGGQARMMGVLMGAAAALEMDATEKALKFYQVCNRQYRTQ
jgi:hypothetical protein